MFVVLLALTLFTSGLIIAGAITDFLKLRIPNILPILIIGCFAGAYTLHMTLDSNASFQDLSSHLYAFIGSLIVMMILFFMRLFGGGDAKIIPAIALWTGAQGLGVFLMLTTIAGGVLALLSIALRKTKIGQKLISKLLKYQSLQDGWVGALAKGTNVVPYGIAIAVGGIGAFRSLGYLP